MTEFLQVNRENMRNSVGTVIEYFNPTLKTCLLIVVAHLDCSDFNSWTSLCFSSNMTSYPAGFFSVRKSKPAGFQLAGLF